MKRALFFLSLLPLLFGWLSAEEFYVLENSYQQLVFSTKGGALSEINLPFQNEGGQESPVKEIAFDRQMVEQAPFNAYFPAVPYFTAAESGPVAHEKGQLGGYYPLLRRELILNSAGKTQLVPARYFALNLVSDFPEFAELPFTLAAFDKNSITFTATQEHRKISKRFSFVEKEGQTVPYLIQCEITIDGDSKGLWITSGIPEVELISGSPAPQLKFRLLRNGKSEVEGIDLPKAKQAVSMTSLHPSWVSNSNGYFTLLMNPTTEIGSGFKALFVPGTSAPTRLMEIDRKYQAYKAADYPGYQLLLPLPNAATTSTLFLFAGPLDDKALHAADQALTNPETGEGPDFSGAQSFQGWFSFISEPFAKFLYLLMSYFYALTHSWAAAIVLLTIALRIMLYPLNAWSFKSMRRMQLLAPEVSKIQERYKKDPKKAQVEIMNLYREKKVNPFTGCFPILIQIPFLMGMFDLLKSHFALRGAPFIPGWINDLTAPDVLFSWSYPIPFIGTSFHLLPIFLGVVMFWQQRLSAGTQSISQMTDQQRQQRVMGNIMVVVFTVMFYHFPSGLNIYWLCSMLLGILQQWWTNKQLAEKKSA